mmetsp:Transcript_27618/g.85304  ORF Transcript_27618/g.85304 Transcript_27618/m.85304 type:complete len:97 (-) Transcript_27618:129-419(-)
MVIGPQRSSCHGQLVARKHFCLFGEPSVVQRDEHIAAAYDGAFIRDSERGHTSGVDLAMENERFVVTLKDGKNGGEIMLRREYAFFAVRPMASRQS